MDLFLAVWKPLSIALTGAFGMLGLVTEYKDKTTGKLTRAGRISLCGIVIATIGGLVAQLAQSANEAAGAKAASEATSAMVSDLSRLLTPLQIDSATFDIAYDCGNQRVAKLCKQAPWLLRLDLDRFTAGSEYALPGQPVDSIGYWILIYRTPPKDQPNGMSTEGADLGFAISSDGAKPQFYVVPANTLHKFPIGGFRFDNRTKIEINNGTIKSELDLAGATLVLWGDTTDSFAGPELTLHLSGARSLIISALKFKKTVLSTNSVYEYRFPHDIESLITTSPPEPISSRAY